MTVAAIILAAGASRRLGQPKQLLTLQDETLLARAVRLAQEADASPILAVLGSNFREIRVAISSSNAISVHNDRWRQGIASSIHAGLRALSVCAPEVAGALLMGCDQPRVTADHLRALINTFSSQDSPAILASSYAGVLGVPAVFPQNTFAELKALRGDKGARSVIEKGSHPVIAVECAGGEIDIDSPADLAQLQ
jgi:CTP:molybdopterin cytidylyltransferase MocA